MRTAHEQPPVVVLDHERLPADLPTDSLRLICPRSY